LRSGESQWQGNEQVCFGLLPCRNITEDSSRDFFADGIGEQWSTDLTRFHDLSVISYYSFRHADGKTI
jgi:TolB-like protein